VYGEWGRCVPGAVAATCVLAKRLRVDRICGARAVIHTLRFGCCAVMFVDGRGKSVSARNSAVTHWCRRLMFAVVCALCFVSFDCDSVLECWV
jgi:hypothetical protein